MTRKGSRKGNEATAFANLAKYEDAAAAFLQAYPLGTRVHGEEIVAWAADHADGLASDLLLDNDGMKLNALRRHLNSGGASRRFAEAERFYIDVTDAKHKVFAIRRLVDHGARHRPKGDRLERAVTQVLRNAGFGMSGTRRGRLVSILGVDRRIKCKTRVDGFRELHRGLDDANLLIIGDDRLPPLAVIRLGFAIEIMKVAENSRKRVISADAVSPANRAQEALLVMTAKPKLSNQPIPETKQQLTVSAAPQVPATSEEALDRHLAEWGGRPGRLIAFNGSTGIHRTLDDDVEVPPGTKFIMRLHETRKGFIKFNVDGPPDVQMVRIDENAEVKREDLGDDDKTKWPIKNGERTDPWIPQYVIPMVRHDAGGELFGYVARGIVAMTSAENLLGSWRFHPKRQEGLIPVVSIENGTYWSKKLKADRPKPISRTVGWVTKTGAPSPPPTPIGVEMNDEIPDFSKSTTSSPDREHKGDRNPKLAPPV
jgi:hypothetical protein